MAQATLDPIERTYRALRRRRLLVWAARIGLPFVAIVAILGLIAANFAQKKLEEIFGGPVSFNPDGIVIQSPTFRGTMSNGLSYVLDSGDVVYGVVPSPTVRLKKIDARLFTPDNREIRVATEEALFLSAENKVQFNGRVDLLALDGSNGYFLGGDYQLNRQVFTSQGPLHFEMACGSTLDANSGVFDSETAQWTFERARLTIIQDTANSCGQDNTTPN